MKWEKVMGDFRKKKKLKQAHWVDIYIQLESSEGMTSDYIIMQRRDERFVMELSTDALLNETWEVLDDE